jgi:hypothetical protein
MGNEATNGESRDQAKTKPRNRTKPKGENAGKVKMGFVLSVEASQRIIVHAGMLGMTQSELVERLANEHLKRFVVQDRGGMGAEEAGQGRGVETSPYRNGVTAASKAAIERKAAAQSG